MIISGKAFKYGDDVSTDLIYPGRYTYLLLTEEQMAEHALEDLDAEFAKKEVCGGVIVAGKNWGCGSAREQAVKCIRQKGIKAIIAEGIARIYYRNCINEGLLPVVCPEAARAIQDGDEVTVDLENSVISAGESIYPFPKFPPFVLGILQCGGLIESVKREIAQAKETK